MIVTVRSPVYNMRNIEDVLTRCELLPEDGALFHFKLWDGDAPEVLVEMKCQMAFEEIDDTRMRVLSMDVRSGTDVWRPLTHFVNHFGAPRSVTLQRPPEVDVTPGQLLEIYSNLWCRLTVYW